MLAQTQAAIWHNFVGSTFTYSNSNFRIFMTSSNGNIFRVTGPICGEIPAQRPVTRSFDVFLDLRLNKRLSKHSWGWWSGTPSRSLRRHPNEEDSLSIFCYSPWPLHINLHVWVQLNNVTRNYLNRLNMIPIIDSNCPIVSICVKEATVIQRLFWLNST